MAWERVWAARAEMGRLGKSRQLREVGGQVTWQWGRGQEEQLRGAKGPQINRLGQHWQPLSETIAWQWRGRGIGSGRWHGGHRGSGSAGDFGRQ